MDPWLEALFRWTHVVAGILWIGHLYFFNFVNAQVAKTYDPDSRKKVVPELMPRALYFFRWGAVWTWVSGLFLAASVHYMVDNLERKDVVTGQPVISHGAAVAIALAAIVVVFFVYDAIWKALAKNEKAGAAVSFVLFALVLFLLSRVLTGRSVFTHAGILFGTIMAMNVWMRIWPSQKKIIQGVKGVAPAPDPSVAALATLRSKHNTYMSVPLVFAMVSNHYPTVYGWDHSWIIMSALVLVGWAVTRWLYAKSAGPAPTNYGAPQPSGTAAPTPGKA
ncbi:MAG TPA: urate hydroxylase PuuD [Anaeromyxobacteraceae bacterium]|nr:urate hydroxylase PuuD [Anaeromyxobacteraceae bacterium]